jgi:ankyrin repeat protein
MRKNKEMDAISTEDTRVLVKHAVARWSREWGGSVKSQIIPVNYDKNLLPDVCMYGDFPALQELIASGINIHDTDEHAVQLAAEHGHIESLRLLIAEGADIRAKDDYALKLAAKNGELGSIRCLLEHGANIHADKDTPIRWAAEHNQHEAVCLLVELGASLEKLSDRQRQAYDYYKHLYKKNDHDPKNLAEAFNAATWVGHVPEMVELWNQIPEILQKDFDFQSALSAVNRENLKQSVTKKSRITLVK